MSKLINRDEVLEALRTRAPRAAHVAEVCVLLGLPKQERDRVLDVLEELAHLGLAKQMPGRRFRAVRQSKRQGAPPPRGRRRGPSDPLEGRLGMHVSGFGFVVADDGGPDVFIPPPAVGGAIHGDRVKIHARSSPKGRDGEVVEILERGTRRVGGVIRRAGGNAWIDPDDPRMRGPMVVVGNVPKDVRSGLQVVAEILRYPRFPDEVPEVEIVDVLGESGITEVEVAKLKLRDGIVEEFPPEVLAEAEEYPASVSRNEKKRREDLRGLALVTIDPSDARDHDDALWGERLDDGGYRIVIAIADVSYYVREGTAIDAEAQRRGTSIYLPDRAIPMLPPELSSNLASLVPNKDRLAMAVEVELGPSGGVRKHRFLEGVMRSRGRITYEGAARTLGLTEEGPLQKEAERHRELLETLHEAAQKLRTRRMRRGSLDFDLPEPRVRFDEATGEPIDVYRQKGDPGVRKAYQLVEEMMLLANEVVAAELNRKNIPAIYRVHGKPDETKIARFCDLAESFGYRLSGEAATTPKSLSKFLRRIEGTDHARPLSYLLLRAMQQAVYDVEDIGHFGLGAKHYLHFTSPIRRYPDLTVHRVLRALIRGEADDSAEAKKQLRRVAIESSRLERKAMELERDVIDLYRAILMRDRVGEEFDATVSGVAGHGFYSSFDEPFVDALTPVERLEDYYELDDLGVRLTGRRSGHEYALGDRVRVVLESVSIEKRDLLAAPIDAPRPEEGQERDRPRRDRGNERGRDERDGRRRRRNERSRRDSKKGGGSGGGPKGRRTKRSTSGKKGGRKGDKRRR